MKAFLDGLTGGFERRVPLLLQTEAAECGLACLGMIAGYHGFKVDLGTLRQRFPVSLKGTTLAKLIWVANQLGLGTRPVKVPLESLGHLQAPAILHWEFSHFVVLAEVQAKRVTIFDPAFGERRLSLNEVSRSFTGVALELWPGIDFKVAERRRRVRLRDTIGPVTGLGRSLRSVLMLAGALEVFTLLLPLLQEWVVDDVIASADRDLLTTLALAFGLLLVVRQFVDAIRGWFLMRIGAVVNLQWRANVFARMLQLPVAFFEKRHIGDVISRFGSIDVIQQTLTTSFIEGILDGVMAVVTLTMMIIYSKPLAAITVITMTLYGIGRWRWYDPLRNATEEKIVFTAKQQSHFLESVRNVKVIKLFQKQDFRRSIWLALLVDQINADLRTQRLTLLYRIGNGTLFGFEHLAIIWLGASLVIGMQLTVGMLIAFLAYKTQFDTRVSSLIDKLVSVRMLQLQADRLADIVLTPTEESHARHSDCTHRDLPATLEIRNLKFRFSELEPNVLDGLSLSIGDGESVVFVGPSGGGKSTLLNLLTGVLEPVEGEVLMGGIRTSDLGADKLRSQIGTVLQDDVLFAGSIADNISFFDPTSDREWLQHCAMLAAIHSDIEKMPMGYNTLVGDMGSVLSGGQKQRVLLARALYKKPKFLFLDEATSSLDVDCERAVNSGLETLKMTRIVIAHRKETIAYADRVITLINGKIAHDTRPGTRG